MSDNKTTASDSLVKEIGKLNDLFDAVNRNIANKIDRSVFEKTDEEKQKLKKLKKAWKESQK